MKRLVSLGFVLLMMLLNNLACNDDFLYTNGLINETTPLPKITSVMTPDVSNSTTEQSNYELPTPITNLSKMKRKLIQPISNSAIDTSKNILIKVHDCHIKDVEIVSAIIDIKKISIKKQNHNEHEHEYEHKNEILLNDNIKTFDLLQLVNGKTKLLANSYISPGIYNQIQLEFGTNSYLILKDGTHHPLKTMYREHFPLILMGKFEVTTKSILEITLDFDAEKSIYWDKKYDYFYDYGHQHCHNHEYMLNPFIKVESVKPVPFASFINASNGGTVGFDNGIKLEIPPNALSENTTISISQIENPVFFSVPMQTFLNSVQNPPKDHLDILQKILDLLRPTLLLVLEPDGLTFNTPAVLKIPAKLLEYTRIYSFLWDQSYNPSANNLWFTVNSDLSKIQLSKWQLTPPNVGEINVTINHFSYEIDETWFYSGKSNWFMNKFMDIVTQVTNMASLDWWGDFITSSLVDMGINWVTGTVLNQCEGILLNGIKIMLGDTSNEAPLYESLPVQNVISSSEWQQDNGSNSYNGSLHIKVQFDANWTNLQLIGQIVPINHIPDLPDHPDSILINGQIVKVNEFPGYESKVWNQTNYSYDKTWAIEKRFYGDGVNYGDGSNTNYSCPDDDYECKRDEVLHSEESEKAPSQRPILISNPNKYFRFKIGTPSGTGRTTEDKFSLDLSSLVQNGVYYLYLGWFYNNSSSDWGLADYVCGYNNVCTDDPNNSGNQLCADVPVYCPAHVPNRVFGYAYPIWIEKLPFVNISFRGIENQMANVQQNNQQGLCNLDYKFNEIKFNDGITFNITGPMSIFNRQGINYCYDPDPNHTSLLLYQETWAYQYGEPPLASSSDYDSDGNLNSDLHNRYNYYELFRKDNMSLFKNYFNNIKINVYKDQYFDKNSKTCLGDNYRHTDAEILMNQHEDYVDIDINQIFWQSTPDISCIDYKLQLCPFVYSGLDKNNDPSKLDPRINPDHYTEEFNKYQYSKPYWNRDFVPMDPSKINSTDYTLFKAQSKIMACLPNDNTATNLINIGTSVYYPNLIDVNFITDLYNHTAFNITMAPLSCESGIPQINKIYVQFTDPALNKEIIYNYSDVNTTAVDLVNFPLDKSGYYKFKIWVEDDRGFTSNEKLFNYDPSDPNTRRLVNATTIQLNSINFTTAQYPSESPDDQLNTNNPNELLNKIGINSNGAPLDLPIFIKPSLSGIYLHNNNDYVSPIIDNITLLSEISDNNIVLNSLKIVSNNTNATDLIDTYHALRSINDIKQYSIKVPKTYKIINRIITKFKNGEVYTSSDSTYNVDFKFTFGINNVVHKDTELDVLFNYSWIYELLDAVAGELNITFKDSNQNIIYNVEERAAGINDDGRFIFLYDRPFCFNDTMNIKYQIYSLGLGYIDSIEEQNIQLNTIPEIKDVYFATNKDPNATEADESTKTFLPHLLLPMIGDYRWGAPLDLPIFVQLQLDTKGFDYNVITLFQAIIDTPNGQAVIGYTYNYGANNTSHWYPLIKTNDFYKLSDGIEYKIRLVGTLWKSLQVCNADWISPTVIFYKTRQPG